MKRKSLCFAIPTLDSMGGEARILEKFVEHYKKSYDIKIITGQYLANKTFPGFKKYSIKSGNINSKNFISKQLRLISFFSKVKSGCDLTICLGFPSTFVASNNKTIWYCNTPPRLVYDLRQKYLQNTNFIVKSLANMYLNFIAFIDKKSVNKVIKIFDNSENVKKRVSKYYGLKSEVLYLGIEHPKITKPIFKKELLTVSRLYSEKRVDLIVRAMDFLPDFKLNIVGSGPEEDKLKKMSKGNKNINFLGSISDKELDQLYRKCYCTIYVPYNEDFGLIPVESNSYGKICIGANEGGLKETIIGEKTGFLIDNPDSEKIANMVKSIRNPEKYVKFCIKNSQKFTWKSFFSRLDKEIQKVL